MKFEQNLDPASRKQPSSSKLKPPSSISRYNAPTSTTSTSSDYTSTTSTSTTRPSTQAQRSLDTEHYYSLPTQEPTTNVRPSDIKRHQIATSAAASTSGATLVYLDPSRHHYSQQYQSLPVDNTTSNTTRSSGLNVNKVSSSLSIEDSNNNHSAATRNHRSTTTIHDIVAFNSMMPASATAAAVPSSSSSVIPHRRAISTNAAASSAAVAGSSLPLPASSSNIKRLTAHFSNTSLKHSSVPLSSAAAAATGAASQSIAPLKTTFTSSAIPGFSSSSTYRHSIPTSLSSMCFIFVCF